jgi:hypothetical protein
MSSLHNLDKVLIPFSDDSELVKTLSIIERERDGNMERTVEITGASSNLIK